MTLTLELFARNNVYINFVGKLPWIHKQSVWCVHALSVRQRISQRRAFQHRFALGEAWHRHCWLAGDCTRLQQMFLNRLLESLARSTFLPCCHCLNCQVVLEDLSSAEMDTRKRFCLITDPSSCPSNLRNSLPNVEPSTLLLPSTTLKKMA